MSLSKKKEEEKEKKFLGRLSYKLDYDFDKNAQFSMSTHAGSVDFSNLYKHFLSVPGHMYMHGNAVLACDREAAAVSVKCSLHPRN
ncbi:hypothetical protein ANCDUO_08211 [Ancylostoma duodenale]|uniref:Uncharacterized protein n=1 Tax=Ancylostoma duodenale TaxID=51022 RepID=A0A0C2CX05_9BILA|nr:hypothetical protein ANCDUO_08211 [Ancylostoma duodenale]